MKTDKKIANHTQEESFKENEIEIEQPTYKEVRDIIIKLKENKAPGTDNIPAEIIKYRGYILKHRMYKLILLIWKKRATTCRMAARDNLSNIHKGDRTVCSNYRPIMLLNMAYKIFTILLNNRLSKTVDSKLSEAQAGFRPNRSTLDNILIICQTFEKCHEYNIDLHNISVDYLQAFNSINRNKVTDSLNEYNIPSKLIKLIALTLSGTSATVKINNELTGKFDVQTGVKQGDPLSATLFSVAMDCILKKMEMRGNISTRLKQCTAYADDILITARTTQAMIDTFVKLKTVSLKYGLTVNVHKTKYLKCSRRQDQLKVINI